MSGPLRAGQLIGFGALAVQLWCLWRATRAGRAEQWDDARRWNRASRPFAAIVCIAVLLQLTAL